ncbi:MAG: HAD-IA family hydrolase [Treponema sp.]|nr:HAD-IA family hydrolase [Treponema sp.]
MLRILLFDLDNTLYSDTVGMDRDIVVRMNSFVARTLDLGLSEAAEMRRERTRRYGTTLEWLMAEHGFTESESWFAAIHPEGEESAIQRDPGLRRLLESMPLPKVIFTNSPMEHADRVLDKLGVGDLFDRVYDIRFNGLKGKPHGEAIRRVLADCGVVAAESLLVDDLPKYVRGFVEEGGHGILLDEFDRYGDQPFLRIHSLAELPSIIAGIEASESQLSLF